MKTASHDASVIVRLQHTGEKRVVATKALPQSHELWQSNVKLIQNTYKDVSVLEVRHRPRRIERLQTQAMLASTWNTHSALMVARRSKSRSDNGSSHPNSTIIFSTVDVYARGAAPHYFSLLRAQYCWHTYPLEQKQ
jgi:hypothetical protein